MYCSEELDARRKLIETGYEQPTNKGKRSQIQKELLDSMVKECW